MKKTILTVLVLAVAVEVANADFTFGEPVNLKSVIPAIDPLYECVGCFSYDRLEMYFYSFRPEGQGGSDLWALKRASISSDWGPPENLGPTVNASNADQDPTISADGLALYFGSKRLGGYGEEDIYVTTRTTKDAPWSPPVNLGPTVNSAASDGTPWISPDGLELYFRSIRSGGYGGWDIYVARRAKTDDTWGEAANLGPVVNSTYTENYFSLSPDGLLLLFSGQPVDAVPRPGGYGNSDMWMTRRASLSSPWRTPTNLGSCVNSSMHEIYPRLSPDGSMLYFLTRDASGTWEHWQASLEPICDFNGDGQVDGEDLLCIVGHWGTDEPLCDIGPFAWGDGTVDLQDLIVLAEHLGKEVTDPSLIAHWPLDETDGITARERVSGSDDVVMGGAIWHPADGIVDGALELDGADDCIITGFGLNPADPEMSSGFCIFAWIKGGGPGQTVLSEPMGASWLMTDTEGKLMTELAGAADTPLLSDAIITDGQWHRVGLAWDGSRRALCVDGFVVAEDTQDSLEGFNGGFYIGVGNDYAADTFFSGLIDDVRVYSRAIRP